MLKEVFSIFFLPNVMDCASGQTESVKVESFVRSFPYLKSIFLQETFYFAVAGTLKQTPALLKLEVIYVQLPYDEDKIEVYA